MVTLVQVSATALQIASIGSVPEFGEFGLAALGTAFTPAPRWSNVGKWLGVTGRAYKKNTDLFLRTFLGDGVPCDSQYSLETGSQNCKAWQVYWN